MQKETKAPRIVARQFATPLSEAEVDLVAGGCDGYHPGPGTCTPKNDDD